MNDELIYRQAAIAALGERPMSWTDSDYELGSRNRFDMDKLAIDTVPSVDAVPVEWIEGEIKRLREMDNDFAGLAASIINTMLKRYEKEEKNEQLQ